MKIAVISPSIEHLHQIGAIVQQNAHIPLLIHGGKSKMGETAERERPDIMFVEGMCCDPAELAEVERVTTAHPSMALILVCVNTSPEFLLNSMRSGVREVILSPASADAINAAIGRISAKMKAGNGRARARTLAFVSCKGGSGATFIASNIASYLSETRSVLLIDLNLQFGDALSFVCDSSAPSTLADLAQEISRLDGSLLDGSVVRVSPSFHVLSAPEDPGQAIAVKPEHIDKILTLAETRYDFVILDVGRVIDAMTVRALDHADRIFPVLQLAFPDVRNAKKMLGAFRSLGYASDKIEMVVNRFERSAEIGLADIERSLGQIAIHVIQNSYRQVCASINHGSPITQQARGSSVAKSLLEFAMEMVPGESTVNRGLFDRLLKRA